MSDEEFPEDAQHPAAESLRVTNEFGDVIVRKVYTRCGERLEVFVPHSGKSIRLDPLELEALTWQDKGFFSTLLRGSLGPPRGDGPLP